MVNSKFPLPSLNRERYRVLWLCHTHVQTFFPTKLTEGGEPKRIKDYSGLSYLNSGYHDENLLGLGTNVDSHTCMWQFNLVLFNPFLPNNCIWHPETFSFIMSLPSSPWDLGSAWAERAGQRKVGGCTQRVQTAWPCQSLLVERPWLALEGPFLSFLA